MKRIASLLVAVLSVFGVYAASDWKMHTTFDEEVTRLIDTPDFVYFTSRTQPYVVNSKFNNVEYLSLFRYDKKNDEMENLSTDNLLSFNTVSAIEYSPALKCLVVVYTNHDIDVIYDDKRVVNISAYRYSNPPYEKTVNSVYIDSEKERAYLSTKFGYVVLNMKKNEIAESRLYGVDILSTCRVADQIILVSGGKMLAAAIDSPRLSVSDYTEIGDGIVSPKKLVSLDGSSCLVLSGEGNEMRINRISRTGGNFDIEYVTNGKFVNPEYNSLGVTVPSGDRLFQFYPDGKYKMIDRPKDSYNSACASYDLTEVWHAKMRKGIWSHTPSDEGPASWVLTRDCILPNSPAPFMVTDMVWHPERGLLVVNHGTDPNFSSSFSDSPLLLSAYKNGMWSNVSPIFTHKDGRQRLKTPNGLAVDPDNPDYVYFGSLKFGLERINMSDGTDILHMSRKGDPGNKSTGYVEIVPDQTGDKTNVPGVDKSWAGSCKFSAPKFDAYGNMWTVFADYDDQVPLKIHLYCWSADDRKASYSLENVKLPQRIRLEGFTLSYTEEVQPLKTKGQKNYVLYSNRSWAGEIVIIDTNGTPFDTSDDRVESMSVFTDQDGSSFDVNYIRFFWEDPSTGNVWVGHNKGIFYFDPDNLLSGVKKVTRVKVPRNDGTNLADYLLDGVPVNKMTTDGNGRKWFATGGAGIVVTSSDGRTVEKEITSSNSPLPADIVYGLGYIPDTNSMMISTAEGMAEHFIAGSGGGDNSDSVRVYPNPVRPDFFGYVTIEGMADGSLVKIVDASGNLVKELGIAENGSVQWDVTNLAFKRVTSGVYFVLCSTDENGGNMANVGKVLVIN